MTRLGLCTLALALAVGPAVAVPSSTPVETAVHHQYPEMGTYQENEAPGAPGSPDDTTTTTTPSPTSEGVEQWLESFIRAVQRQLQLQDAMMRQLIRDIQEYLSSAFNWSDSQTSSYTRVTEMMDMITNRMSTAIDSSNELMTHAESADPETVRRAMRKYMKEVRVQDVVVDALWASLRGVQTSAWMNGVTAIEKEEATPMASRAAEEFIHRMYHNLRAAGMTEEDVAKFIPKSEYSSQTRNMGRKGRGYGYYGYSGYYGYPYSYGYSYPYSYSYSSYPSYYSYPYSYSYSSYPYYSYSYPSYYWRRLRPAPTPATPTAPCPDCPPVTPPTMPVPPMTGMMNTTPMTGMMNTTPMTGMMNTTPMTGMMNTTPMTGMMNTTPMTGMMNTPPMVPPVRTLGTEPITMGTTPNTPYTPYTPMMGFGTPEFTPFVEGVPPMPTMPTVGMETPFEPTTQSYRNLAPVDLPVFAEPPMRQTPFGFGPVAPSMLF